MLPSGDVDLLESFFDYLIDWYVDGEQAIKQLSPVRDQSYQTQKKLRRVLVQKARQLEEIFFPRRPTEKVILPYQLEEALRLRQLEEANLQRQLEEARLRWGRFLCEQEIFRGQIRRAKERQARLLWAAAVVAPAIGAERSWYHCVQLALQQRGVKLSRKAINMRVLRFEKERQRNNLSSQGILEYLFDGFKGWRWRATHKRKLYVLHEKDGQLTGLSDKERQLLLGLCEDQRSRVAPPTLKAGPPPGRNRLPLCPARAGP